MMSPDNERELDKETTAVDGTPDPDPRKSVPLTLRTEEAPSEARSIDAPASPRSVVSPSRQTQSPQTQTFGSSESAPDGYSSWSTSSDRQLGLGFVNSEDRIFPIRSAVSVDPAQTPSVAPRSSSDHDGFPGMSLSGPTGQNISATDIKQVERRQSGSESNVGSYPRSTPSRIRQTSETSSSRVETGRSSSPSGPSVKRHDRRTSTSTFGSEGDNLHRGVIPASLFSDGASVQSAKSSEAATNAGVRQGISDSRLISDSETESKSKAIDNPQGGLITARFKHIVTKEGHAVITGRDGEVLQRCEDEPIHIPGAVQGFGLLLALKDEAGKLLVRIASENSQRILGFTPQELFSLDSFTDILSEDQADNLLDHVDFIRDEDADPASNGPEVFTLIIRPPKRRTTKLWCAMHINPVSPETIICEFELEDDPLYPAVPPNEETPEPPEDTLNSNPTDEEFAESTKNTSKPLRVLRSARKRKGEAAAMEVFNIMSQIQEQLASAPTLEMFLKVLIGVVKELTGFHRVMIYQFDSTFNGRVVTELVDPRATKDLYKGLHFPASDIPKQARDLYRLNRVRLLYDRDLETARLVCRTVEDIETPLDLSYSYLRAMSPIHIKYLANMAVRSSMSISIMAFDELWGLIACHTYGSKGMRVSFPIRKMCRLIGDTASRNIERLSYASRLQARKLINTVPTEANPSGYIIASSDDLLTLFDADFGLLSIRGETKVLGKMASSQEALALLEYLRLRKLTSVVTSQDIKQDFPDLVYGPGFHVIAGLLLVPLSVSGQDFIAFFRRGQVKEVKWAGNPYEKFIKEGTEGYLEPRKSFKTWSETVVGKCREWTEEQVETAAVLCLVYGKFIEVWRQKEAALQNSQLTKLLLANSAHEVRTPLNAIINYLEIALEGNLDHETRDNLAKSHSASKSLIYVINDLLDLTKTEEGLELIREDAFDIGATIREATNAFKDDAGRKGIEYIMVANTDVPDFVLGDQRRVRQAISNITANALQNTTKGSIRVEYWLTEQQDSRVTIEIVVEDTGCGMSSQTLDALFSDLEQVSTDTDQEFFNQIDEARDQNHNKESVKTRTLGLGLAIVGRIVRNMGGQLRLKSEEGQGSRFMMQLPFDLPDNAPLAPASSSSLHNSSRSSASTLKGSLIDRSTEVTLIDNESSKKRPHISRRKTEENRSIKSFKSVSSDRSNRSSKSDVDRLIDAISEPLGVGIPESEEVRVARSNSRGHSGDSRPTITSVSGMSPPSLDRSTEDNSGVITPEHLRLAAEGHRGAEFVTDNKTLLKAVRMPDEYQSPGQGLHQSPQKVVFNLPARGSQNNPRPQNADHLQILVAEDDPVNSKIMKKRLEKAGHQVHHVINGEACASVHGDKPAIFDAILMDMQMPIVDGLTSTKMIRSYEKTHAEGCLSPRAKLNGRIPIIAVSASLVERELKTYTDAGFDGWILKPVDFNRLFVLLTGMVDEKIRAECLYQPGEWEKGGIFERPGLLTASDANTRLMASSSPMEESSASSNQHSESTSPNNDMGSFTDDTTPE